MDKDDIRLPDLISTITDRQWLDLMSAPRFDHTKKKRRTMTHPRDEKRKRSADKQKKSKGTEIGEVDDDGWEFVDPNAPEEPGFEYEERPAQFNGGESHSDSSTAEEH